VAGKKKRGREGRRFGEPRRGGAPAPAGVNPKLATQTRKLLGKHYASKYRQRGRS
jgi:hypothetical protein